MYRAIACFLILNRNFDVMLFKGSVDYILLRMNSTDIVSSLGAEEPLNDVVAGPRRPSGQLLELLLPPSIPSAAENSSETASFIPGMLVCTEWKKPDFSYLSQKALAPHFSSITACNIPAEEGLMSS